VSKPTRVFVMEGKCEKFLPARRSAAYLIHLLEDAHVIRAEIDETLRRRHLRRAFEHWGRTSIPIGYLAAHGTRGNVFVGGMRGNAALSDLGDWIGAGKGAGRVLVLGTCLTLGSPREAVDLLDHTGLTAVVGYRRSVDTVRAAAWEMLLIDELAEAYQEGKPPTRKLRTRVEALTARCGRLPEELGFSSQWRVGADDGTASRSRAQPTPVA
jgi:hypothetical protein